MYSGEKTDTILICNEMCRVVQRYIRVAIVALKELYLFRQAGHGLRTHEV